MNEDEQKELAEIVDDSTNIAEYASVKPGNINDVWALKKT